MPATQTGSNNVAEMAEAIAKQIVKQREDGGNPLDVAAITGSFTLEIKYKDTTYSLVVTIPDTAGGVYEFTLSEKGSDGKTNPIASFKYKDSTNWKVAAGLPFPITFGDVTIETVALALGSGTV